jgi:hypothetical protein
MADSTAKRRELNVVFREAEFFAPRRVEIA